MAKQTARTAEEAEERLAAWQRVHPHQTARYRRFMLRLAISRHSIDRSIASSSTTTYCHASGHGGDICRRGGGSEPEAFCPFASNCKARKDRRHAAHRRVGSGLANGDAMKLLKSAA